MLKGIQTAEDAELAGEHGVDAIVVSNHGGRQLDAVAPTAELLPEIVAAVAGRLEVYVDGGIRRGSDAGQGACARRAGGAGRARPAVGARVRRRGGRAHTCSSSSAPRSS